MTALLVALGAAVGAPLRFLAGRLLDRRLHWGTLAVNLVGSFVLGALVGRRGRRHLAGAARHRLLRRADDLLRLRGAVRARRRRRGTAYVVVTVAGCLAMATLGHLLAAALT